jgi:hypothetical protein
LELFVPAPTFRPTRNVVTDYHVVDEERCGMWILFKFIGIIRCGASISRFIHSGSVCLWILRFLNDLMIYSILRAERSSINRHALLTIHPSRTVFHYFIWLNVLLARSTTWTTVAVRFSSSLIAHDLSTKHISCFISERPHFSSRHGATLPVLALLCLL